MLLIGFDPESNHAIGYESYGGEPMSSLSLINVGLMVSICSSMGMDFDITENNVSRAMGELIRRTLNTLDALLPTG